MQVSPVNSTNFKAHFKKTQALENLLKVSDIETLGRFNEVIDRMSKVNDGFLYKITFHKTSYPLSYSESFHFFLNREVPKENFTSCEEAINKCVHICDTPEKQYKRCSDVLKQFLPHLEKRYPKTEYPETNTKLMQKIIDKLV